MRRRDLRPAVVVAIASLAVAVIGQPPSPASARLGPGALELIQDRAVASSRTFCVYRDADAGCNHGFPSGFFGDVSRLSIDAARVDDPLSLTGCARDASRLDRERGTVLQVSFDPMPPGSFAGLNIEEPERCGSAGGGRGHDLRGTRRLVLHARSPSPGGVRVQLGVADGHVQRGAGGHGAGYGGSVALLVDGCGRDDYGDEPAGVRDDGAQLCGDSGLALDVGGISC